MEQDGFDPEAGQIATRLLDLTGQALLNGDAAGFIDCFSVPHRVSTFEESYIIADKAGLRRVFFQMCASLRQLGVTDMVRHCIAASFRDVDTVAHSHISHLMAGHVQACEPYPCFSILRRQDGIWRVASSDYALDSSSLQAKALGAGASTGDPAMGMNRETDW